jgi:predicted DNA binding CopG/RHH family protein
MSFFFLPGHISLCYATINAELLTGYAMKDKTGAKRQRRYSRRRKQEGKHHINVFISNNAYQAMRSYQAETGMTYGNIIDRALLFLVGSDIPDTNIKPVEPEPRPEPERPDSDTYDSVLSGLKKRIDHGETYNAILHDLCLLLDDMRKDNLSWQDIADRLNQAGIPKRTKGQWTFKAVTSTYYRCQKR